MAEYQLHDRLGYRVSKLARIMQGNLEARLAEHGLSRLMWLVLTGIGEEAVRTPSEMADYIGITRPATSRLLNRMEELGFVMRNGAEGDGRRVALALSDKGRTVLRQARPRVDAMTAHFTAKIAPDELDCLMRGLARLAEGEGDDLTSL